MTSAVNIPSLSDLKEKPKVIAPSTLAHVVLQTTQLQAMKSFYTTFLGAYVVHEAPFGAFITYDDEHHRIALVSFPSTKPSVPNASGLHHIAFTFKSLPELLTAYVQRKKHGIEPKVCVNHGPTTSMYYKDPDGNMIEVQVDNFDTAEEATRYMMSEDMARNAIGVEFVPEDLIEKLRGGVSEAELKVRQDNQSWGIFTPESFTQKVM